MSFVLVGCLNCVALGVCAMLVLRNERKDSEQKMKS